MRIKGSQTNRTREKRGANNEEKEEKRRTIHRLGTERRKGWNHHQPLFEISNQHLEELWRLRATSLARLLRLRIRATTAGSHLRLQASRLGLGEKGGGTVLHLRFDLSLPSIPASFYFSISPPTASGPNTCSHAVLSHNTKRYLPGSVLDAGPWRSTAESERQIAVSQVPLQEDEIESREVYDGDRTSTIVPCPKQLPFSITPPPELPPYRNKQRRGNLRLFTTKHRNKRPASTFF